MHEKNFENEVRQKMEELSFVPSAPVWEKVAERIKKKRERRRIVFWILPLLLLSGGFIWWSLSSDEGSRKTSLHTVTTERGNKKSAAEKDTADVATTTIHQPTEKKNGSVKSTDKTPESTSQKNIIKQRSKKALAKHLTTKQTLVLKQKALTPNLNTKVTVTTKQKSTQRAKKGSQTESYTNDAVIKTKPEANSTSATNTLKQKQVAENKATASPNLDSNATTEALNSVQKGITPADTGKDSTNTHHSDTEKKEPFLKTAKDSSSKKKIATRDKKWQKIITVQTGISAYKEGLFANNSMELRDPINNSSINSLSFAGVQTRLHYPAKPTKGASFAVGGGIKRLFGKRIGLSAVIQYHFYNTHVKVGEAKQKDTTVLWGTNRRAISEYYTNTGKNDYTTKFGIIEVPVTFSYQLFKKVPLQFSTGAAYGHLLASNALTFNSAGNFYYYNRDNNVRNYISIFSSLQYRFPSKTGMNIQAGPVIQFTPSELQNENKYTIPHLLFAGLKTDISF